MYTTLEDLEESKGITWLELVELEPRLEGLMDWAKASRPQPREADRFNYEVCWSYFKQPISELVGHFRNGGGDPRLRTGGAYLVGYFTLWQALHDEQEGE